MHRHLAVVHAHDQGRDYEISASPIMPPEPIVPSWIISLLLVIIVLGEKLGSPMEALGDWAAEMLYSNRIARYGVAMTAASGVGICCYALVMRMLG